MEPIFTMEDRKMGLPPIFSPSILDVTARNRSEAPVAGFNPLTEPNVITYTPYDWATVFTNTARTTPVTANGQVVRGMNDIGPLGRHVTAAAPANGPLSATDGSSRKNLHFDSVLKTMLSAVNAPIELPVFIAVLATMNAATGNELHPTLEVRTNNGDRVTVGTKPSSISIRSYARILSKGVGAARIDSNVADFVVGTPYVFHLLVQGGDTRLGLDGTVVYNQATPWTTETLDGSTAVIGGAPAGGLADNNFHMHAGVIALGAVSDTLRTDIIAWLISKK